MSGAWRIGTFRGIALNVHVTFVLLLTWILLVPLLAGRGLGPALTSAAYVTLLFGCVVLHELGHALTAQRYGIATQSITLYPIGGIARLLRMPREPRQELWIALAGPAVNGVIALLLFGGLTAAHAWAGGPPVEFRGGNLPSRLLWTNLALAGFNLLPAFPMDGGRVLRAFLAGRMEYRRATRIAATVGRAMAFLFGLWGLLYNPFLLFIAIFVYFGAEEELMAVEAEWGFRGVPVSQGMMTQFETLSPADPLSLAVERLLAGAQNDFPVVDQGVLVGMLSRAALVAALEKHGADTPVAHAMRADPAVITAHESLEAVYPQVQEAEMQSLPVVDEGRLVGLITLENVAEWLLLRQALDGYANRSAVNCR